MKNGWSRMIRMASVSALVVASVTGLVLTGCSEGVAQNPSGEARGSAGSLFGGGARGLFAKAEAAAESGNINFFGFYTGMPEDDLVALGQHYGFGNTEESELFYSVNVETHEVYSFRVTLKGVRRITKAGNTFGELAQAVANQVGTLQGYGAVYGYKTIDGVTLRMDEEQGCTIHDAPRAQEAEMAAQRQKEAEFARQVAEIPSINKQLRAGDTHQAGETEMVTLPGGAQMEMVWCPPGAFLMGSSEGGSDETPHRVTLTKGFWMAKTEVTQKQWKSVMGNNPSRFKGDDLPVENVSWNDCQEFCQKTGLRLPTEAEWEYACRAGSTGEYAGTGNLDEMGWYEDNSDYETHPVGTKKPNAWGLCDMHGNVFEWCADWKGDYPNGAVTDPEGASSGWSRVRRGGGWHDDAGICRSAFRGINFNPSYPNFVLGFRPARVPSGE